jgi:hypothetical protein
MWVTARNRLALPRACAHRYRLPADFHYGGCRIDLGAIAVYLCLLFNLWWMLLGKGMDNV